MITSHTSIDTSKIDIGKEWLNALMPEFDSIYMDELKSFIIEEKSKGKVVLPPGAEIFRAFKLSQLKKIKVVILGQDPYHGVGQAHGLCFSVKKGIKAPPSLINIYKELKQDLDIDPPQHGNLEGWAKQGVLLLNSVLTVEKSKPASHQGKGWERFTDKVIKILNDKKDNLVFILWGAYAQKKGAVIDRKRHLVIESPHPSPFSARRGFFNSSPFSKCNKYLIDKGIKEINWKLPN